MSDLRNEAQPGDRCVRLLVPGEMEYLDVVRTVVAREARRLEFSFDAIEDVCVAVDEACALLLTSTAPVRSLHLEVEESVAGVGQVALTIRAISSGCTRPWPPERYEDDLGWQLLRGLADEVHLIDDRRGPTVLIRQSRR